MRSSCAPESPFSQVSSHLDNIVARGASSATSSGDSADAASSEPVEGAEADADADGALHAAAALAACLSHYAPLLYVSEAPSAAAVSQAVSLWTDTLQSAVSAGQSGEVPQRRAEGAQLMALTCLGLALGRLEGDGAALAQVLPAEAVSSAAGALIEALRGCPARPAAAALASGLLRIVLLPPKGFERGTQADVALGALPSDLPHSYQPAPSWFARLFVTLARPARLKSPPPPPVPQAPSYRSSTSATPSPAPLSPSPASSSPGRAAPLPSRS